MRIALPTLAPLFTLAGCAAFLALPGCAAADPAPWAPGELVVEQIGLDGLAIGEAALVVGPSGDAVLIDVGNDRHADEVDAAIARHGRAPTWAVLTHYHADHVGALDELDLDATLVTRGPFDLDARAANAGEWAEVCASDLPRVDLCVGAAAAPCDLDEPGAPWPATSCEAWSLDLGDGATLEVLAANGWHDDEAFALGHDDEEDENARSLVGVVRWGDFRYVFAGDLTGGGKDTPDVEGWLAPRLAADGLDGADVLHLAHHGIRSSTGDAWADALLPDDGAVRHAVVGATGAYLAAPADEVLERVAPRLGGGRVWATDAGMLAGSDDALTVVGGSVLVRVADGGASARVEADGAIEGVGP